MHKILELRERAKQELGPKSDLCDFHKVVLKNGGTPLALLGHMVDTYVAQKKKVA
jgi:uncharacterized protein (DUF885 family)